MKSVTVKKSTATVNAKRPDVAKTPNATTRAAIMHSRTRSSVVKAKKTAGAQKLSDKDVRDIRKIWQKGKRTQTDIAEQYAVHSSTVSLIVNRHARVDA